MRCLEIGPNKARIPGFETLDAVKGPLVDHVGDCRKTPFPAASFDLVYACHVIEHVEWSDVEATIAEWARILKPGGILEVHTIDAHRIMKSLVRLEETGEWDGPTPGKWCSDLTLGDPYLWASGRILNRATKGSPYQMHRALITPKHLRRCIERAGLTIERQIGRDEMRRAKHLDWINIGYRSVKP